jgi:hypothetical protein
MSLGRIRKDRDRETATTEFVTEPLDVFEYGMNSIQ